MAKRYFKLVYFSTILAFFVAFISMLINSTSIHSGVFVTTTIMLITVQLIIYIYQDVIYVINYMKERIFISFNIYIKYKANAVLSIQHNTHTTLINMFKLNVIRC